MQFPALYFGALTALTALTALEARGKRINIVKIPKDAFMIFITPNDLPKAVLYTLLVAHISKENDLIYLLEYFYLRNS